MSEAHPCFVEITCPCCDKCRHCKEEEVHALRERVYGSSTDILCDDCWWIVQYFVKKVVGVKA